MSDKRKNRKNNFKEKRTILLAKKNEQEDAAASVNKNVDAPKLLLKAKDKTITSPPNPPAISIATRDPPFGSTGITVKAVATNNSTSDSSTSSSLAAAPSTSIPSVKESTIAYKEPVAPVIVDQVKIPQMSGPVTLVTDHYQIETTAQPFIQEANNHFYVVGVIGTQGTGKSTLINLLCPDKDSVRKTAVDYVNPKKRGVFSTTPTDENLFSTNPTTEGIQMYITSDRTILLDCSPILCNPYKKDCVLNEFDDLKLAIFMICVCQTVLVVDEEPVNLNLLRLLGCAEMMKPTLDNKEKNAENIPMQDEHFPRIMFVQNRAEAEHFLPATIDRQHEIYRQCMKQSRLRIFAGITQPVRWTPPHIPLSAIDAQEPHKETNTPARRADRVYPVNTFLFPRIKLKETPTSFNGHVDIASIVKQFQQRVFMGRRLPFPGANPFTEKNWWQLAVATWESHKTNYFLRKYESEQA